MAEKKWQITARSRTRQRLSRSPLTTGWLRPDTLPGTDLAVGVFSRDDLSDVLSLLHARGVGQTARVFDPARGEIMGQLRRAGVTADLGLGPLGPDAVLVVVRSPGRGAEVGDLMLRANAQDVRVVLPSAGRAVAAQDAAYSSGHDHPIAGGDWPAETGDSPA